MQEILLDLLKGHLIRKDNMIIDCTSAFTHEFIVSELNIRENEDLFYLMT